MFSELPRELSNPSRKLIFTRDDFESYIHENIHRHGLFTSLYQILDTCKAGHKLKQVFIQNDGHSSRRLQCKCSSYRTSELVIPDKLLWDIDSDSTPTPYKDMQKLHQHYINEDILHCINLTGVFGDVVGYHIIPIIFSHNLKNPFYAIKTYQHWLMQKLGLKINAKHISMFGNLSQIVRLIDTYNFGKKSYCVPLKIGEICFGINELKKISKHPRGIPYQIFGTKKLDLSYFDTVPETQNNSTFFNDYSKNGRYDKELVNGIDLNSMSCMNVIGVKPARKIVADGKFDHRDRFCFITFCRDKLLLSEKETAYFMHKKMTTEKYMHMIKEVSSYKYGNIGYVFNNSSTFPSCEILMYEKYCGDVCEKNK